MTKPATAFDFSLFKKIIDDGCAAIVKTLKAEGVRVKTLHSPLAGTSWSSRSKGWFPEDPLEFPTRHMDERSFQAIATALASCRDGHGNRILGPDYFERLERSWVVYSKSSLRVTEGPRNAFWELLQNARQDFSGLSEADGFVEFLFGFIYPKALTGSSAQASSEIMLLIAALQDRSLWDKSDAETNLDDLRMQACFALLAYIAQIEENPVEDALVAAMQKRHAMSGGDFLAARVMSHQASRRSGSIRHLELASAVLHGRDIDICTALPQSIAVWHNAAKAWLQRGYLLSERMPLGLNMTVAECIDRGVEATISAGPEALLRHMLLYAMGALNEKKFGEALRLLSEVQAQTTELRKKGARMLHIELREEILRATVAHKLVEDGQTLFEHVRDDALRDAIEIGETLGLERTLNKLYRFARKAGIERGGGELNDKLTK